MQDIFEKTERNILPVKKFASKLYEQSKIFSNKPETPSKKGRRNISTENIKIEDYTLRNINSIKVSDCEIKFHNVFNRTSNNLRNFINPNTNVNMQNGQKVNGVKTGKLNLARNNSKVSTNVNKKFLLKFL